MPASGRKVWRTGTTGGADRQGRRHQDEPDVHTDVPEQIAKDAGDGPVIIDRPTNVPEQIAKDAADPDRR